MRYASMKTLCIIGSMKKDGKPCALVAVAEYTDPSHVLEHLPFERGKDLARRLVEELHAAGR